MKEYERSFPNEKVFKKSYRPFPVKDYLKAGTPDCVMFDGDKLSVGYVHQQFMGDGFDHPHDSEIRFAFLRVTRKNEETKD
jgi:hypothetical protein